MLDKVSDKQIAAEYKKRFALKRGDLISSSTDALNHLRIMLDEDPSREYFAVLFLNGQNALIKSEIMFKGTLTTAAVYPREIIKRALELSAAAIVVSHNHPSGNLSPSREDIQLTSKIKSACDTMDIAVHDHLLLAGDGYYSFSDHGLL